MLGQHPDLNRHIHKYYGKYRGIVLSDDKNHPDGEIRGRLRVKCPTIFPVDSAVMANNTKTEIINRVPTVWANPCFPYGGFERGIFFIPPKDSTVWVEFEAGDINFPIWTGVWSTPAKGKGKVPTEVTGSGKKLIRTDVHLVEYDDDAKLFHYHNYETGVDIVYDGTGKEIRLITKGRQETIANGDDQKDITGGDWKVNITGNVTITPTQNVFVLFPSGKKMEIGAGQDSRVVTTRSICPFTGQNHPMGADNVFIRTLDT